MKYVDDPKYVGYVIRKNSSTLMKAGGPFLEAAELYRIAYPGIKVKVKDQKIVFPSGAQVCFSHYENDTSGKEMYRGLQISGIMYDEASQATVDQIFWLLSRNRSNSKYNSGLWLTMNPSPDCYAFDWVQWYLYPKGHELEGRPDPSKDGKIRWMLRRGNDIAWADTREELVEKFGENILPIQFQAIFATIYDNPPLIDSNPDYLASLESLPRVEKERLLYGNWLAREESTGYFKREWIDEINEPPPLAEVVRKVRAWDIAGSLATEATPDVDYTASVLMSKTKEGYYVIEEVTRFRARYGEVLQKILETARRDGTGVEVSIPVEPGQAGKAAAQLMAAEIIGEGFVVKKEPTNKSKVERFRPFASACENKMVKVVKNCGTCFENKIYNNNNFFYEEMEKFNGVRKYGIHDDVVDGAGDAFRLLAKNFAIPNFSIPDMSQANPFRF